MVVMEPITTTLMKNKGRNGRNRADYDHFDEKIKDEMAVIEPIRPL